MEEKSFKPDKNPERINLLSQTKSVLFFCRNYCQNTICSKCTPKSKLIFSCSSVFNEDFIEIKQVMKFY